MRSRSRRWWVVTWLGGWLTLAPAWAQSPLDLRKLDPYLAPALTRPFSELPYLNDIVRDGRLRALVRTTGNPYALTRLGVLVTTAVQNIASVSIPPERLRDLLAAPDVLYVEGARRMRLLAPMLEASAVAVGATALHHASPSYTGRNVAIGIVDAGIDINHPAFRTAQGRTRVLALWDQVISVPGRNPPESNYGTEWTSSDIDAGRVFGLNDPWGHGTHIAGVLAGNGRWTDDPTQASEGNVPRVGIAPNADLILVKSALLTPDVLDGVAYILIRARQFGLPVVVNMSFGNMWGPHDGRGLLNEGLELLAQNAVGVAFVAAAGNDGDVPVHARFTLHRGDPPRRLYFRPFFANESVYVEAWQSLSAEIEVTPLFPRNAAGDLTDFGIGRAVAGQVRGGIIQAGPAKGLEWYLNYLAAPAEYPDLDQLYVQLSRSGDYGVRLDENVYALEFSGTGTVDVYIHEGEFVVRKDDKSAIQPDSLRTVGSPAESTSVIAVGSYATRMSWLDSQGVVQTRTHGRVGKRSDYSSIGPRRDDFEKPDVLAPGEYVLAPLSSDMVAFVEPDRLSADGRHIAFRGTSLSSAHVAGLAALLLEQNPTLTPAQVRDRMRAAGDALQWTPENGKGFVDGLRLLGVPSPPRGVVAEVSGSTATVTWTPNDEPDVVSYRVVVEGTAHEVRNATRWSGIALSVSGTRVFVVAVNRAGRASAPSETLVLTPNVSLSAPTNVRVEPLESRLAVSWKAVWNATRYRVEWGTTSGVRPNARETGETSLILDGLTTGVTYYVAVRALDALGNASQPSEETRATPRKPLTLSAPLLPVRTGFPVETGHDLFGSPAVADVDGDGKQEIFVGGADGKVYAYRADGSLLPGWPQSVAGPVVSSVSIGDLDRDGRPEIVATAGRQIHAWNPNGTKVRNFPVTAPNVIRAEPVLANLDADPSLEIVVSVAEGNSGVYAWDAKGQPVPKFPFRFDEGMFAYAPPVVADRDYDGTPEIYAPTIWGPVYGWNIEGKTLNGFPILPEGGVAEHAPLIAANLTGDELSLIINGREIGIAVIDTKGKVAAGYPRPVVTVINAGVAAGDLDGDGIAEIVGVDERGYLYAWHRDGIIVEGYPVALLDVANVTPLLADFDDDGKAEIIAVGNAVYNTGCVVYVLSPEGTPLGVAWTDVNIVGTPTLADLDGDGKMELVAATLRREEDTKRSKPVSALGGRVFVWNLPYRVHRADWTTHQGGATRLGVAPYGLPAPSAVTRLTAVWLHDRLRFTWQTTQERGNIGYELYRSESPTGPFERIFDGLIRARGRNTNKTSDYVVEDTKADPKKTYYYRLVTIGSMNRETVIEPIEVRSRAEQTLATQWGRLKKVIGLAPFPVPANPEVWIPFRLGEATAVTVLITRLDGSRVRQMDLGVLPPGDYVSRDRAVFWDGRNDLGERVASGVYLAQVLVDGAATRPRRILFLK